MQCGPLIFSSTPIYTSPLAFPILAISLYSLPVTAQPGDPTSLTSLSIAHTALTLDSSSSTVLLHLCGGIHATLLSDTPAPSSVAAMMAQQVVATGAGPP